MKKGFTLIEMIITITVIIVLSAISVPIYKNYQADAILAEGYVLLGTIREAQKNYYSEWGMFLQSNLSSAGSAQYTNNETVLGIDARGNKYYTWFQVGSLVENQRKTYHFIALALNPPELRTNGNHYLILQYNISLGQRFGNKSESSWF